MKKIFILEDDINLKKVLVLEFQERGYLVESGSSLKEINDVIYDVAVLDLNLGEESGLEAISRLKSNNPFIKIVMLTGYGSIATTVEAMKLGALNYLTKPISIEDLLNVIEGVRVENDQEYFKRPSLSKNEHEYIQYVLNENDGNISKTAKELGLHRQSLQRKLKKNP